MWRSLLARLLGRPTAASSPTLAERAAQGRALAAADARSRVGGAPTPGRAVERAPDGARELADDASCLDEAAPSLLVRGRADRDRLTPPIGSEVVRQATEHLRRLGLALALVVGAGAAGLPATLAAQDVKIRDLTTAEGAAPIRVVGYGIAVGLDGTGDRSGGGTRGGGMTVQSVVNLLRNFDVEIPSDLVRTRNAAVVLVTAEVSPYLRAGGRFEVQVASLGDARSLRGGVLYMTPLVAEAGGRPVAVAQGPLMLSDGLAVRDRFGPPTIETTGRIPSGGQLEADLPRPTFAGGTRLLLKEPDVATAARIAQAVNTALGAGTAKVEDPGAVALTLADTGDRATALMRVRDLAVRPERVARIVIDARDGTVVAGGDLTVGEAVVSHGSVTLAIGGDAAGAAGAAGAGAPAAPGVPGDVRVAPGTSVQKVAAALHAVQAPPTEIAAIFAALRDVGALAAEIVVR
jgi:flagellar P-ring protein precursor FlgI